MTSQTDSSAVEHAVPTVNGIQMAAVAANIRYRERNDLVVFAIEPGSQTAAVFTKNAFCAAPVQVAKQHLQQSQPRYLVINSGNANAGTGREGLQNAQAVCRQVAELAGVDETAVLPFSTGVIGQQLPVQKFTEALPRALEQLGAANWRQAAKAIMTTDTVEKLVQTQFTCGESVISLVGIAKGAGMICPNMATMLAFVATDVAITQPVLQQALSAATEKSFNSISVDGDTSTNDACVLIATGKAGNPPIDSAQHQDYAQFAEKLDAAMLELALKIVRDGEGATKCVSVQVGSGKNYDECKQVAYTIAHSPLVKTAMFANDPNWGRILAAIGRAPIAALDVSKVSIALDDVKIVEQGVPVSSYREADGQRVMSQAEYSIRIELGRGNEQATVWTTDLSHDYVTINAEYRT